MKIIFYSLFIFLFFSCGNSSEEKKEATNEVEIFSGKSTENSRNITDTAAKQLMDMWGMEGETFHDMMKTDSLETEIRKLFTEEGVVKMIRESNLSEKEQRKLLQRMQNIQNETKETGSKNLPNSTKEKMDTYFAELETALASSGSEQQLKELQTMMARENINEKIGNLSKENISPQVENIRKTLGTDSPTLIEQDLTTYSMYGGNTEKKQTLQKLAFASKEEGKSILAEHYQISEKEVDLLKNIPASPKIGSVKVAEFVTEYNLSSAIENHLQIGKPSSNFKILTSNYLRDSKLKAKQFIDRAKGAKKEFYTANPGWYGEGGETGDTYIDSRSKFVYLPLGAISFADKVISHQLGRPAGSHSNGAIGEPDMSTEKFDKADPKICNLGERGVLTLEFTDNAIADVIGPDLYVFEMGQIEPTNLEISKDGKKWINVGKIEGGTAKVDIAPFIKKGETYNYVRLTDLASYSALPGADVDAVAAIGGALRINLDSAVLFDTGKFQIKETASKELEKLVAAIKKIPKGKIIVEGHTDNVGNTQSNKTLSENRAQEVSIYLKKNLSNAYQYETMGYGEGQPITANDIDENRQKNRRVEILVIPSN